MDLVIRPLITADVDEVVAFSVDAWGPVFASVEQVLGRAVFLQVYPDWLMSHAEFVRGVCLGGKARVWVADVDGHPVGFVAVIIDLESSSGEIEIIGVDPRHQRKGIGNALMTQAVDHIRRSGCGVAVVATGGDPGHAPARATYESAGFTALPLVRYHKSL
ncbi:GNAT family acetyltransferase [Parafrankia colletiae]|uniref:GNAT family acetyltransferase n=1 Tax=Parafrankia colletiae TaxID=573497 RepID=A0A1S1Q712_9ACTN|nr:GNAT family N-acetyltransferase [Parafrankia colletiae]MCK9903162.1 GNAT family N-acetyltransferase [Frankia sp. Cpl3]OHV29261.1 GNAT family acetyltransferase [Parafrankia colletiae]